MIDSIPAWLAAPLIAVGGVYALYVLYIAPRYARDREETATRPGNTPDL